MTRPRPPRLAACPTPLATALALLLVAAPAVPASPPPPPGPLGVHALVGARVVTAPGRVIENGTVVIRDGMLEAVGESLAAPPDADLLDLSGLTVYPGLIDPYATRSWPIERDEKTPDPAAGHPNVVVHPERDMSSWGVEPAAVARYREAGYTTAAVAPREGLLRGWSAVFNLGDGPVRETLLAPRVAQAVRLDARAEDGYPESLMGSVALTRQTFLDAVWYSRALQAYERHPGQHRPVADASLAALAGAAQGDDPVVFENEDLSGTLRAARLARELGLDAWLVGSGEEYQRLDAVAATELPLIVTVDFPEPPKPQGSELAIELAELRHWRRAPANPAALAQAGVTFSVTSHGLDQPKDLHARLARAIAQGLDPETALAAATVEPAKLLGLEDRLGTLEAGKIANLVVAEGDLFADTTRIREVWIDGRRYEIAEREAPEVEPAGTWDLRIDAGDTTVDAQLVLVGEAPTLTGTLTAMGATVTLSSAEVSGTTVEIAFEGSAFGLPGPFEMTLEIEGERAEGGGAGPPGPFTVEGTRATGPPPTAPERQEVAR